MAIVLTTLFVATREGVKKRTKLPIMKNCMKFAVVPTLRGMGGRSVLFVMCGPPVGCLMESAARQTFGRPRASVKDLVLDFVPVMSF